MPPIPSSSLSERGAPLARWCLVALLSGVSCAPRAAAFPTRPPSALDEARTRTPDGVLTLRLPGAMAGNPSALSADGDVALRPPLPLEGARDVVDALLRALVDEDLDRLREIALPDASTHNPTIGRGSSVSLHASFRERVRRLDYHKLEGLPLAVKVEMEVYTLDDIGRLPPGRPEVPPDMVRGDALVRARIATPRVGPDRFFGDVVEVHLRSTDTAWLVVAVTEEMPMP